MLAKKVFGQNNYSGQNQHLFWPKYWPDFFILAKINIYSGQKDNKI